MSNLNRNQLVRHLTAHANTCSKDALYFSDRGDTVNARYHLGKADAYLTAAAWLEELTAL